MWRFAFLGTAVVALAAWFFVLPAPVLVTPADTQQALPAVTPSSARASAANSEMQLDAQARQRQQQQQLANDFKQRFNLARQQGQGNMQAWLLQLWQQCQAAGAASCSAQQAELAQFLSPDEQQWLTQALANFSDYQRSMMQLEQSMNTTLAERLAQLSQLRHSHFAEQSALVFGDEERLARYQLDFDELQKDRQQYSAAQRLEKLSALQDGLHLSEQKDALFSADARYQQALALLDDLPANEQRHWQRIVREQYFAEQAQAVERYEQQQAEHKNQQRSYQQALAALNAHWQQQPGGLTSPAYQQALRQLRQRSFQ